MITVLFATHNGETTLPVMLDSFCRLDVSPGGYKLVAVDNGSTDRTAEILASYRDRLPLTVVQTPVPGKNRALNLAMEHLEGDLVLFCDDDVIVSEGWLSSYRRTADSQPEMSIFCGPIRALWPHEPPAWVLRDVPLGMVYAVTEKEYPEAPCSAQIAWGPNFGIRRALLESALPLPEKIGPIGKDYPMGSESFLYPLADAGAKTFFVPAATVQHVIRPFQLERSWVLGRAYRYGRGHCRMHLAKRPERFVETFGMPRWAVLDYLKLWTLLPICFSTDKRYKLRGYMRYLRGFIREYREIAPDLPPRRKGKADEAGWKIETPGASARPAGS